MINNVKNALIARSKKMTELKASLDEQLKSLPEGSIITKRRKYGTGYYWINNKTKPKYLSKKDSVLIEQLIQKAYIKEVIKSSEEVIEKKSTTSISVKPTMRNIKMITCQE